MTTIKTNETTSSATESPTPPPLINNTPSTSQRCTVRDFIAASLYTSSCTADLAVGGNVLLKTDYSRKLYNALLDRITKKTSSSGIKVAYLNDKEFSQDFVDFNIETATFPIEELLTALKSLPQTLKSHRVKSSKPRLFLHIFTWFAVPVAISSSLYTKAPLVSLIGMVVALLLSIFSAILFLDILEKPYDTNLFFRGIHKLFPQKGNAADYSAIRQTILQSHALNSLANSTSAEVQAFTTGIKLLTPVNDMAIDLAVDKATDEAIAKALDEVFSTGVALLITVSASILKQQHNVNQNDIISHIENLKSAKIISNKCVSQSTLQKLFANARNRTIQELKTTPNFLKLKEKAEAEKHTKADINAFRNEIIRLLGSSTPRQH